MIKTICAAGLFAISIAQAQIIRTEESRPTTPREDAKPNTDTVPDVYALNGAFERIVVLRFKYRADLLKGLESAAKEQNIRNAVILSGIGSVRNYSIHAAANRTFPSKDVFLKDTTAPADIAGMNGYIINGRVHAHITLANETGAFGGHLEPETNVFTFAIVTIGVFKDGIDLSKVDDKTYR